jgi:similar to spore coat protein
MIDQMMKVEKLDDGIIAADLDNYAKAGIRNYAWTITETATPKVRDVLSRQLNEAIKFQELIANYMIGKGYYDAYDISSQWDMDLKKAHEVTLNTSDAYQGE